MSESLPGKKKRFEGLTAGDKVLLPLLIILSVCGFVFIKKAFPAGSDVNIEINGKPAYKLPLNSDRTVQVKGVIGDTIVEIKDRKVRIKESSCPSKTCIHSGWIERGALVCLPNRVTVLISGPSGTEPQPSDKNRPIDAISG